MKKRKRKKLALFEPNENKKLEITVDKQKYFRFPLFTSLFEKGDDVAVRVKKYVLQSLNQLVHSTTYSNLIGRPFFIVVSEKIVAISQGRSYFIWDVKPTLAAKILSNYVTKTPSGIGLGSQWTMQLAIQEVGLPKILLATLVSALSKPFGFRGLFYKIAGEEVASIDGPTEYSLYPSNVSAKLGPKDPDAVAEEIYQTISNMQFSVLKKVKNFNKTLTNFQGVVIIDANDLGRNVLGNSTKLSKRHIEKIFQDNPMGQSDEQTPIVLVFEKE